MLVECGLLCLHKVLQIRKDFFYFLFICFASSQLGNLFNTHETNVMNILYTYMQFKDMIRIRQLRVLNQCINVYNFFHTSHSL